MPGQSAAAAPFFSIVIPTRDRLLLLRRAIESCLDQSFADFEVIVVDDGSQEDVRSLVQRLDDPRLRYVWQENAGAAAARNHGAEVATGQYLAFLDSDDAFLKSKLEAFHAAIQAAGPGTEKVVWYSQLYFYRGEGNRIRKPEHAIRPADSVGDYLFVQDGMMQTSTLVIPRPFFNDVGFNRTLRNLQDLDLCLRLEAAGGTFRMLPTPQVIWYDDTSVGRLSYSIKAEDVMKWAAARKDSLSDKAYYGFLARYLVPICARKDPLHATQVLRTAIQNDSISIKRAASLFIRGAMPRTYGRVRDALVSLRRASP